MRRKMLFIGLALLIVVILTLVLFNQIEASRLKTPIVQQESLVEYLKSKFDQLGVPVKQIVVLQENPLEIEVTIQSSSTTEKYAPDDFVNVHMVVRESVFASDRGYPITGLTKIVVNTDGKQISKGWIKIEPDSMYRRIDPPQLAESSTVTLLDEKLAEFGLSKVSGEVTSFEGYQTLNLYSSNISIDEAKLIIPPIKDSLHLLAQEMNLRGVGAAIVSLKMTGENGETLLNYLLDLQFATEGWWIADGIDIDIWYPSIPSSIPAP